MQIPLTFWGLVYIAPHEDTYSTASISWAAGIAPYSWVVDDRNNRSRNSSSQEVDLFIFGPNVNNHKGVNKSLGGQNPVI